MLSSVKNFIVKYINRSPRYQQSIIDRIYFSWLINSLDSKSIIPLMNTLLPELLEWLETNK